MNMDKAGSETVNNKKYVFCPAGGRNCGQSGSRKFFSPHFFWFDRKILSIFEKNNLLQK